MEILQTILQYLPMVLVIIIFITAAILTIKGEKHKVKEWLVWAVSEAESYLGAGTGKLKLRYVYDLFVSKFPFISTFITFDVFSAWVDQSLDVMKDYISKNDRIREEIEGGKEE